MPEVLLETIDCPERQSLRIFEVSGMNVPPAVNDMRPVLVQSLALVLWLYDSV